DFIPFALVIIVAASSSFATPIGYQTNLMVYGPGGYKYTDFVRIGLPLNLIVAAITVTLVPQIWAF
ncbi:MAG: SLC13 family permease, partial [Balneolaceae bacterium]